MTDGTHVSRRCRLVVVTPPPWTAPCLRAWQSHDTVAVVDSLAPPASWPCHRPVGCPCTARPALRCRDDVQTAWPASTLITECRAVWRRSKRVSIGTRRHQRRSRLGRRCALHRRGNTPRLRQIICATTCEKLSEKTQDGARHGFSGCHSIELGTGFRAHGGASHSHALHGPYPVEPQVLGG
jgi:hypothetical protein